MVISTDLCVYAYPGLPLLVGGKKNSRWIPRDSGGALGSRSIRRKNEVKQETAATSAGSRRSSTGDTCVEPGTKGA